MSRQLLHFRPRNSDKLRPLLLANIERQTEDWFEEGYKFVREQYFDRSPYRNLAAGKPEVVRQLTQTSFANTMKNTSAIPSTR